MPNRRRRKLSTAMSAVAALAVVSPIAVTAITDLTKPAPQPREFRQAAVLTDLPNELLSALSQGLSQFGINLPPMPTSLLTGSPPTMPTTLTAPGALGTAPLNTAPDPAAAVPALGDEALADPALTPLPAANPALTPLPAANQALPNAAMTSPTAPGGLTTPQVPGTDPATTPISNGVVVPEPGEVPISGTYPILGGDPLGTSSLGAVPTNTGGGGIIDDINSAAETLGVDQAMDLFKGLVMPLMTSAMKSATLPAAPPVPAPPPLPPPAA